MAEAFVLRRRAYSESDWIVEFFLEDGSLVQAFARSARRSVKRFPHQFRQTALYDVKFSKRASREALQPLQSCELITHFAGLEQGDLRRLARWSSILEWLREEELEAQDFQVLKNLVQLMNQGQSREGYLLFFRDAIARHGLEPNFNHCQQCQRGIVGPSFFSPLQLAFFHETCGSGFAVSQTAREWWASNTFEAPSSSDCDALEGVLAYYLQDQLGRQLKSLSFLKGLDSTQARSKSVSPPL